MKLAARLVRRLLRGHDDFTQMAIVDLETRLARKLTGLAAAIGEQTDLGVRIGMKLSQSLLASAIGASRENVNRALSRMTDGGIIKQTDGYIVILDEDALTKRAQPG
jgi:CRP-like cAMP-binding protein